MQKTWLVILTNWKICWLTVGLESIDFNPQYNRWEVTIQTDQSEWTIWVLKLKVMKENCLCYDTHYICVIVKDWFLHYN